MEFKDKISVVVPFRNVKPYLADCLNSIKNQTYTNFEVILLDDDSDDGSEVIAEEFAKEDKRFIYYRLTKQPSIAAVRNLGVEYATGKYLSWVDSDDIVSKDFLKILHKSITSGNYQMSACKFKKTSNRKAHLGKYSKKLNIKSYSALEAQKICLSCDKIGGYLPLKLLVTDIARQVKFNGELKACEDLAYVIEYLELCSNICLTSKKLYLYYMRRGSLSRSGNLKKITNFARGVNYIVKYSKDKPYYNHALCWKGVLSIYLYWFAKRDGKKKNHLLIALLRQNILNAKKLLRYNETMPFYYKFYVRLGTIL